MENCIFQQFANGFVTGRIKKCLKVACFFKICRGNISKYFELHIGNNFVVMKIRYHALFVCIGAKILFKTCLYVAWNYIFLLLLIFYHQSKHDDRLFKTRLTITVVYFRDYIKDDWILTNENISKILMNIIHVHA